MATEGEPGTKTELTAGGQGGGLLCDPGRVRGDARMIARMVSLGVVSPKRARDLLRKAYDLAERCADAGEAREFAALLKVILGAAKLGQDERKQVQQAGTTNIQINGDVRISNPDERRAAILDRIAALRDRAGTGGDRTAIEPANDPQPAVPQPPID